MSLLKVGLRSVLAALGVLALILVWANWPASPLSSEAKADRLVVSKSQRTLAVLKGEKVLMVCPISLGGQPLGAKSMEGDQRTPEGVYRISQHKADSTCYRALRISYSDAQQMARARSNQQDPGGNIMIHGLKNGWGWLGRCHRWLDWTAGCVAVTNSEMDRLWVAVQDGTTVELRP